MDARRRSGEAGDMRTVAEWFGEGRRSSGDGDGAVAEDVRRAVRGAQDAITRDRVPRRHSDLVRRVFQRYADSLTGKEGAGNDGPAVGDADSGGGGG